MPHGHHPNDIIVHAHAPNLLDMATDEYSGYSQALFSWWKLLGLVTIALSFVFDNYYLIMD
jgi:hypothetical protein